MTDEQTRALAAGMMTLLRWVNTQARCEKPGAYDDRSRPARVDKVIAETTSAYKRLETAFGTEEVSSNEEASRQGRG